MALVEPIGFTDCSVRYQREAVAAIEAAGSTGHLGIVHDTFQHALAGDNDFLVQHIRLVHISGLPGTDFELPDAADAKRMLPDRMDRTNAVGQMRRLLLDGYRGPFSFECTDDALRRRQNIGSLIAESIAYLEKELVDALSNSMNDTTVFSIVRVEM